MRCPCQQKESRILGYNGRWLTMFHWRGTNEWYLVLIQNLVSFVHFMATLAALATLASARRWADNSVDGGFSEYVSVPAKWVVALPKGIDTYKAMCLGTAAFTAALAIHRMEINGLHPEQGPVIVTGSSGGVGSYAINILSDLGYSVTALTSKKEKKEFLSNLGADSILDFNTFETRTNVFC